MMLLVKILGIILVSYLAYRAYCLYCLYTEYLSYKKQGVPFNDKQGFSFFRDAKAIVAGLNKNPTDCPWA
jgi:hypothetical protein